MSGTLPENPAGETMPLAEGKAALWLCESLMLALLEATALDTETMLEAIEIVVAAKRAEDAEAGRDAEVSRAAAAQLAAIGSSIAAARTAAGRAARITGRRRGDTKRTE